MAHTSLSTPAIDHLCVCGIPEIAALLAQPIHPPGFAHGTNWQRPWMPRPVADMVIFGKVQTMNPVAPSAEAIAISDGHIAGVGSADEIRSMVGEGTEVLDIGDGVAYPGLFDPHMHYSASAVFLDWIDCSTRLGQTHQEVLDRLAKASPIAGDWVLGTQYDPSLVTNNVELTLDQLDRAQPDRPVAVLNASMHYLYCNSKAMEIAGITAETPNPEGGVIGKHDGKLTGSLGELAAMMMVMSKVPRMSPEEFTKNVLRINARAAAKGITHTRDAGTGAMLGAKEVDLLHSLSDRVGPRITFAIIDPAMDKVLEQGATPGQGDDKVRAAAWKIVGDGSNQGYSGYQKENYLHKDFRGHPNFSTEYLVKRMEKAFELGWPFMLHANGDASIGQAIDAYRAALAKGGDGLRHRIEHCSFPTVEQLHDMEDLGLSPSFLMGHVYYWGRAFRDDIMGPKKADRLDPMGTATALGLHPTMHSDYTVTDFEPLRMVQTAVERKMRDGGAVLNEAERVSVEDAMAGVTRNAAWQTHSDTTQGTIDVGKFADITILDVDPMTVDTSEIADIGVRRTIVGGEVVFDAT